MMSSTFDKVADIIAETCDIPRDTITPESHAIDDLGIDSLDFLDIAFAIDQQPYLQGYLAVDALWLAHRNGTTIGGGRPVYTGPSFVDASNVDIIADAAQAGLR